MVISACFENVSTINSKKNSLFKNLNSKLTNILLSTYKIKQKNFIYFLVLLFSL